MGRFTSLLCYLFSRIGAKHNRAIQDAVEKKSSTIAIFGKDDLVQNNLLSLIGNCQ